MIKDYIEFSRTTAIYPEANTGSVGELMYLSLGLAGEVGEVSDSIGDYHKKEVFIEKEVSIKELGDIAYYWARIADALGNTPFDLTDKDLEGSKRNEYVEYCRLDSLVLDLANSVGGICNKVKKLYRDEDTQEGRNKIWPYLTETAQGWSDICIKLGLEPHAVLQANMEKLSGRKERGTLGGSGENR